MEKDYNGILEVASLAGKIMLENGGEVYRVEETIAHVCRALGGAECESSAATTYIMMSVSDEQGQTYSRVRRIANRTVNLDKVDAVNRFSRQLEHSPAPLPQVREQLAQIAKRPTYPPYLVALCSAVATGAFAFVFGGEGFRDFICAFMAGFLLRTQVILLQRIRLNEFFINLTGGMLAVLFGWLMVYLGIGIHADVITISALMLLVPGLLITNAVRDIAAGDLVSGTSRSIEAFFVAVALAAGSGLAYTLVTRLGGIWL